MLAQVVAELQSSSPDRVIVSDFQLDRPVSCDRQRIAQLLSNLLGNALTYGAPDQPIRVAAWIANGLFTLTVANAGDEIASDALERLFQPFTRGADRPNRQGLGLGLYIASEVARAHAGDLTVTSSDVETKFTFTMPLG